MNELALFSGVGGGILGGKLLGWRTVCGVEWDAYAASVLVARQNDKTLPPFPIWDDVQTFDGRPWRGRVDVISGGFPCTDISCAGKGAGIDGKQSSMWSHMARIVGEVRPRFVFVENSPMLVGRGLTRVIGDLAKMGYDARWGIVGAHHVSAPHKRDRIWIVANSDLSGGGASESGANGYGTKKVERREKFSQSQSSRLSEDVADSASQRGCSRDTQRENAEDAWELRGDKGQDQGGMGYWHTEPNVGRVANGVANRVDRLKCLGNGQVPQVASLAWRLLTQDLNINNQQ